MKQNGSQDKKVGRDLGKGKVTRAKAEQSKRTRQWKLQVQIHNKLELETQETKNMQLSSSLKIVSPEDLSSKKVSS